MFEIVRVIFRTKENKMKQLLILIVLLLAGCGESDQLIDGIADQPSWKEIRDEVNSSGTITDAQAVVLSENKLPMLYLDGLTSITDKQAEILSKFENIYLNGLISITDKQAELLCKQLANEVQGRTIGLDSLTSINDKQSEFFSRVKILYLNGLTSITDEQLANLSQVGNLSEIKGGKLHLDRLTSLTDKQAEILSKIEILSLNGLTSITDKQAESLSKVEGYLTISEACQKLVDKYKKP